MIIHIGQIAARRHVRPGVFPGPRWSIDRRQIARFKVSTPVVTVGVIVFNVQFRVVVRGRIIPPVAGRRIQVTLPTIGPGGVGREAGHFMVSPIHPIIIPLAPFGQIRVPKRIFGGFATSFTQIWRGSNAAYCVQMGRPCSKMQSAISIAYWRGE